MLNTAEPRPEVDVSQKIGTQRDSISYGSIEGGAITHEWPHYVTYFGVEKTGIPWRFKKEVDSLWEGSNSEGQDYSDTRIKSVIRVMISANRCWA